MEVGGIIIWRYVKCYDYLVTVIVAITTTIIIIIVITSVDKQ